MRLAFTIFKYFPYGGIQRDLMKIAREAVSRGHTVKIFTIRWEGEVDSIVELELLPIVGFYRHTQYENFAKGVAEALRREHFDLVVGFNKMPGLDVYYAGDSCYIEKALTQRPAWYRLLPRFKSFYAQEKAVFGPENQTQILTISNVEVPRYRHHYRAEADRFHELPPGIERDRVAPDNRLEIRARFRQTLAIGEDELVLLFIGSGFKKKGLDRALIALAALPRDLLDRVRMFVIGRDKAEAFERMAMRMGISNHVTFFAEGRDDVPDFLFSADALIHPAYDETAGMVIIEAMLAGLPALVTRNCGYARYMAQYDAGLVVDTPLSQQTLNAALEELLTSPKRAQWSLNGLSAGRDETFFGLVSTAVNYLEDFVRERRPTLAFCLFRYFPFGGLQRDFMRIARACHAAGYDILVYCLEWWDSVPDEFEVQLIEVQGIANHVRYERYAEEVAERIKWRRPELVIGFNKMPNLDLYYAADSCYEYKAQELRTALYRQTSRYKLFSKFERAVFERDKDTHVMLIARSQLEHFQHYYGTENARLTMLPPGVSRDRRRGQDWLLKRQEVREELDVGEEDLVVLLIGSGFITKGVDRALLAFAALPAKLRERSKFLIIGQDNPMSFLRQARNLGIEQQVEFQQGRDDIPAVLQAADVMVHPAYMESGGLVLLEGIIAGLPVIATSVCGFSHHISQAGAGVVVAEPFSQETLNQALADALNDEKQRASWSAAGIAYGLAHEELYDMPRHALACIEACYTRRFGPRDEGEARSIQLELDADPIPEATHRHGAAT